MDIVFLVDTKIILKPGLQVLDLMLDFSKAHVAEAEMLTKYFRCSLLSSTCAVKQIHI